MDASETLTVSDDELRQLKKLSALGTLAAGIAHEINTPIQFVGDNLVFLKDVFTSLNSLQQSTEAADKEELSWLMEEVPNAINQAMDGVARVATIVGAMKSFSYLDRKEMQFADLEEAIRTTSVVARNEYKYVAELKLEFGGISPVRCFVGDFQQVILNMIVNAAHAIEDARGETLGVIRIVTSEESGWVTVAISDSGCGIPDDIRARIFDPFFTTKAMGRGTGQGLALALAVIVDGHNGKVDIESTVGQGTTFFIRLPVSEQAKVGA